MKIVNKIVAIKLNRSIELDLSRIVIPESTNGYLKQWLAVEEQPLHPLPHDSHSPVFTLANYPLSQLVTHKSPFLNLSYLQGLQFSYKGPLQY